MTESKTEDKIFIFGYGSLMYPAGINGRGMRKIYSWKDLEPTYLNNYERGWYAVYQNRYLFYGIIPKTGSRLNGVLFRVHSKSDLLALNESELTGKVYQLKDVTNEVETNRIGKIKTYVTLPKALPKNNKRYRKYPGYQNDVITGIEHWGKEFVEEFEKTTKSRN